MTGKLEGASKALDVAHKTVVLGMLPAAALFLNMQKDMFGQVMEKQRTLFEHGLKTRQMDVDLTVKFFDILESKRFSCFDENKAPLLDIIVQQHNSHNKVQIGAEVYENLVLEALQDQGCQVSKDAARVKDREGAVPIATSYQPLGENEQGPPAAADNTQIKRMLAKALAEEERRPAPAASSEPDVTGSTAPAAADAPAGADGWVAVGRYKGKADGFTNFTVFEPEQQKVNETGQIAPGATLRARWPVFLRRNTSDANQGRNPILGLVTEGTCARVVESRRDLRGQTWAAIDVAEACRSGAYL